MKKAKIEKEHFDEAPQKGEPHLQLVPRIPSTITDGRDELNFAEFPLSAISERIDPSIKTLIFEDKIFDKSKNIQVNRKLTITGSDAFGLPTPTDEEVLLALIQLSKIQNFQSKRVYFTRYQLLQLLKWAPTGQSYARLDVSLKRWLGVTIYYENAWRDRKAKEWATHGIHMLENLNIRESKKKDKDSQTPFEFASSYFEWNEVVFRSFTNGNVKALNYDFFLSIESSIAKRLYRFLDKRFFFAKEIEFDLKILSYEHVGLSRRTPTGDLKRKIGTAIEELVDKGYLEFIPKDQLFIKQAPGIWKVVFKKRNTSNVQVLEQDISKPLTLEQKLVAFGVRPTKASELLGQYPHDTIEKKLTIALWMREKRDSRIAANPPGYLITSIENDFAPPKQFKEQDEAKVKAQQLEKINTERESKQRIKIEKEAAREAAKRSAVDHFWASLPSETRERLEIEAIKQADPTQFEMLKMGGKTGEAMKQLILDEYALEALANG